jgi:hypothetical protein
MDNIFDFSDEANGEAKKTKDNKFVDLSSFQLNESLSDLERSLKLIAQTVPIQLICAFRSISRLAINAVKRNKAPGPTSTERLVELFDAAVATLTETTNQEIINTAVASTLAFTYFVETHAEETDTEALHVVSKQLLRMSLAILNRGIKDRESNKDRSEGFNQILELLPRVMACVSLDACTSIAIPMVTVMADVSRSDESRMVACDVLGAIAQAKKLNEQQCESMLLPIVVRLCQDTSDHVRKCMSHQLGACLRLFTTSILVEQLLSEILELLEDEKDHVRCEMVSTTITVLDVLPIEFLKTKILPVLKTACGSEQKSGPGAQTVPSIPKQFGFLFYAVFTRTDLYDDDSERKNDMEYFLKCYKTMSQHTNETTRRWCAYNFPAVLKTTTIDSFEDHFLRNVLTRFARDTGASVRILVGSFLHEICILLTPDECVKCIHNVVITLLQDSNTTVRYNTVLHLDVVLESFFSKEAETEKSVYQDLLPPIVMCLKDGKHNWRESCTLIRHFKKFPSYFDHASIQRLLVPQLLQLLEDTTFQVQKVICRVLCVFGIAGCGGDTLRRWERNSTASTGKRKIYLIACSEMLQQNSARFAREKLLLSVVTLMDDLVLDVRRKALLLVPTLFLLVLVKKEDKQIKKLLLERLQIESGSKSSLIVETAREVMESERLNNQHMVFSRENDEMLERKEVAMGLFKDMATSRANVVQSLKAANKKLSISLHKRSLVAVSSDDEEFEERKKDTKEKRRGGGSSLAKEKKKEKRVSVKPMSLPKRTNLLPLIANANSEGGGRNVIKKVNSKKRRGPPKKRSPGKSPRAGKNIK